MQQSSNLGLEIIRGSELLLLTPLAESTGSIALFD
jgi:hypothetical protein